MENVLQLKLKQISYLVGEIWTHILILAITLLSINTMLLILILNLYFLFNIWLQFHYAAKYQHMEALFASKISVSSVCSSDVLLPACEGRH